MTPASACPTESSPPLGFGLWWLALALCAMCVLVASPGRADEPAPAPAAVPAAPDDSGVKSPGPLRSNVPGAADAKGSTPPPAALAHYNRGRAHYQAGRYREAVIELEKALDLDPQSPNLVYNVARVYELLGDIERSISFYERYERMLPAQEVDERQRVAATLQRLRGAKEHVVEHEEAPAAPREMKHGVADPTFWVTLGTGAAALAAGGVTGVLAMRSSQDTKDFVVGEDGAMEKRDDMARHTERLALASDVLFLCGATVAVTSVLLYTLREEPVEPKQPAAGIGFGATATGVFVALRGSL
jgi:tetratricopeptide (TPR) repeat protein